MLQSNVLSFTKIWDAYSQPHWITYATGVDWLSYNGHSLRPPHGGRHCRFGNYRQFYSWNPSTKPHHAVQATKLSSLTQSYSANGSLLRTRWVSSIGL